LGLLLAVIGIKGFQFSLPSQCPFNVALGSTEPIMYCPFTVEYLLGNMLEERLTSHYKVMKTFGLLSMLMAKDLESCCQSSCQIVARVVVKGVRSESFCQSDCCQRAAVRGLRPVKLLLEWLHSENICPRASVRVGAVSDQLSEAFCQSGFYQWENQ